MNANLEGAQVLSVAWSVVISGTWCNLFLSTFLSLMESPAIYGFGMDGCYGEWYCDQYNS